MANRLKKLADARYTSGTPYKPAVPRYCTSVATPVPGYNGSQYLYPEDAIPDGYNGVSIGALPGYVPPGVRYTQVCYPKTPTVPTVLPQITYLNTTGWNSGARSVAQLNADGYFEF